MFQTKQLWAKKKIYIYISPTNPNKTLLKEIDTGTAGLYKLSREQIFTSDTKKLLYFSPVFLFFFIFLKTPSYWPFLPF